MSRRRRLPIILAAVAIVAISLWIHQHVRDQRASAERESGYQTLLAQNATKFKPGMTRDQVERQLQTDGKRFRQMCCAALYRGQKVTFDREGFDDLVKIAEESVPWFCRENNVYIAFEFYPKSLGERSGTNGTDILKRTSVSHQLEGCM
jgi:hypothetical protein